MTPLATFLALAFGATATTAPAWTPIEGAALRGTRAPEWRGLDWLQGGPLSLRDLAGKVVLLRFWTDACPYCEATAPALAEAWLRYRDRGLVVVGIHHPKSAASRRRATVLRAAKALGFDFPIATDTGWETVRAYGVGTQFTRFTSVSFVIDREGVIRFVHDGGEFHRGGGEAHAACNAAFDALLADIERLLPPSSGSPSRPGSPPPSATAPASSPPPESRR